jgi:hypothetical protein
VNRVRALRLLAPLILLSFLLAPAASAYSWEKFKEDFQYKPVAFIVAIPAFIITAPIMLIDAALEEDD